jgi:hypothetical protein
MLEASGDKLVRIIKFLEQQTINSKAVSGIFISKELYNKICEITGDYPGIDDRSKDYLDKELKKIGFIRAEYTGWDSLSEKLEKCGIENIETKEHEIVLHDISGESKLDLITWSENNKNYYAAEYCDKGIDDYSLSSYVFSTRPSDEMIKRAMLIEKIRLHLDLGPSAINPGCSPFFNCWECGRKTHWLDCEGNIQDKWNALNERYCGC